MSGVETVDTAQGMEVANRLSELEGMRNIGTIALKLERNATDLWQSLEMVDGSAVRAPEGRDIRVIATHPEDPLDIEKYDRGSDSYDPAMWKRSFPHDYDKIPAVQRSDDGRFMFNGQVAVYDQTEKKVFVYDEEGRSRVWFRSGTVWSLAEKK